MESTIASITSDRSNKWFEQHRIFEEFLSRDNIMTGLRFLPTRLLDNEFDATIYVFLALSCQREHREDQKINRAFQFKNILDLKTTSL